jgi:hypothetical protein
MNSTTGAVESTPSIVRFALEVILRSGRRGASVRWSGVARMGRRVLLWSELAR